MYIHDGGDGLKLTFNRYDNLFYVLVRIITAMYSTGDILILLHFVVLLALNVTLCLTIVKFRPSKDIEKQE